MNFSYRKSPAKEALRSLSGTVDPAHSGAAKDVATYLGGKSRGPAKTPSPH